MRRITTAAAMLMATSAFADGTSTIQIEEAVMVKSFENARAAGGYMMIMNSGTENDLLVDVKIEGHVAMIHESREDDGVMRMLHVDAVEVPAEDMVTFAPGGFHVMVMDLQPGDLPFGEMVEAILIFDRAGEVPVTFMMTEKGMLKMHTQQGHSMTN